MLKKLKPLSPAQKEALAAEVVATECGEAVASDLMEVVLDAAQELYISRHFDSVVAPYLAEELWLQMADAVENAVVSRESGDINHSAWQPDTMPPRVHIDPTSRNVVPLRGPEPPPCVITGITHGREHRKSRFYSTATSLARTISQVSRRSNVSRSSGGTLGGGTAGVATRSGQKAQTVPNLNSLRVETSDAPQSMSASKRSTKELSPKHSPKHSPRAPDDSAFAAMIKEEKERKDQLAAMQKEVSSQLARVDGATNFTIDRAKNVIPILPVRASEIQRVTYLSHRTSLTPVAPALPEAVGKKPNQLKSMGGRDGVRSRQKQTKDSNFISLANVHAPMIASPVVPAGGVGIRSSDGDRSKQLSNPSKKMSRREYEQILSKMNGRFADIDAEQSLQRRPSDMMGLTDGTASNTHSIADTEGSFLKV